MERFRIILIMKGVFT